MPDNFHRSIGGGYGSQPITSHSIHHSQLTGGPVVVHTQAGKNRAPGTSSNLGIGNSAQPAAKSTSRAQGGGSGHAPKTSPSGKPSHVAVSKGSRK